MDLHSATTTSHRRPSLPYYLIDHKILFVIGFIFYLVCPYILGKLDAFHDYPGVGLFQESFAAIPPGMLGAYLLITLSWVPAFFLGHFLFKLLVPSRRPLHLYPPTYTSKAVSWLGIPLALVLMLFIYVSRGSLFGSNYDVGQRGKLSTLVIVYDFFLLYQLISRQKVSRLLVIGTILNALLLLLAGGRLTALQTCLVFLLYKTSFAPRRWTGRQVLICAVIGFAVGSFIGVSRVGAGFSLERGVFSLMAEPYFTWFSNNTFLAANNTIPSFNMPVNFLTSFINMIPNTFFNVRQYVVSVQAMGFSYRSPFGADSIWTSLVINFGSVGSFIFIFVTGFLLNVLRHLSETYRFWAVYYMLICAMLPFEFFRTGFFILNKEVFFNFLLLPALILAAFRLMAYFQYSSEKASPDPPSRIPENNSLSLP